MKRVTTLLALALSSFAALAFTGCQMAAPTQTDQGYTAPATPSAPATTPMEVSPPKSSDVIMRTNQLKVTKQILQQASVGGELKYRIQIDALESVGAVKVVEDFPASVEFISSDPATSLSGGAATWMFPSLAKGETQTIDITVKPVEEGDHQICSTVTVENAFCMDFFSGQPKLDVVKKGPESIELGEIATWNVTVTNSGSAIATNVIVTDELPDSFTPTTDLTQNIGNLAPGETKTVSYSAKAIKQGEFRNRAIATYDGSGPNGEGGSGTSAESSVPISIVQSGIRVRKTGPEEAYVFKPVKFEISIENTGDTDLQNVRITDILPQGTSVADNGGGRVNGDAIGWMIPTLPAGSSQLISTEVAATRKGSSTNTVKVVTANGLEASDTATTNWLAVPGVTVSITDSKDPIRVMEPTTYTIQVRNQGDFEPVSGTVTVKFSDGIKPVSVAGDAQGTINGQTVTFPRTTLEPGKDTNLSITAEGAKIGAGRAIMDFSADFLTDPIISQEATNVY